MRFLTVMRSLLFAVFLLAPSLQGSLSAQVTPIPRWTDIRGSLWNTVIDASKTAYAGGVNGADSNDDRAAIVAAINACPPGGTVKFPPGILYLSSQIIVTRGDITLDFPAGWASTLRWTDAALATAGSSKLIVFKGPSVNNQISNVTIRNLKTSVPQLSDGVNRLTTGIAPDQSGLSAGQFKLPSTGSASSTFYDGNALLFIYAGTGNGQIRYITPSTYNTGTKVFNTTDYNSGATAWTTQPDNTSQFIILLAGGTHPQSTYGTGGIGLVNVNFAYVENLMMNGGWAGSWCQGLTNATFVNVNSVNLTESTIDLRDGCDALTFLGGRWNSGEGCDMVGTHLSIIGVHFVGTDDDDQFVDVNGAQWVLILGCTSRGAAQGVDMHTGGSDLPCIGVWIIDCTFEDFRDWGVLAIPSGNNTVDLQIVNCTFKSTRTTGQAPAGGVKLGGTSAGYTYCYDTTVRGCFFDVPFRSIELNRVQHVKIQDNTCRSSRRAPIYCNPASSLSINDIQITNNDIWGTWTAGTDDANTVGAIHLDGSNSTIYRILVGRNRVHASGGHGIRVSNSNGVELRDNILNADTADPSTGTPGGAMYMTNNTNANVRGNTVNNSNAYGMFFQNCNPLQVVNNTVNMASQHCCWIRLTSLSYVINNRANMKIDGNTFLNPGGPANAGAPTNTSKYCLQITVNNITLTNDLVLGSISNNMFSCPAYTSNLTNVLGCNLINNDSKVVSAYFLNNDASDSMNEYPAVTGLWDFAVIEANTANRTLTSVELNGQSYSNKGATATMTYTLPPAKVGMEGLFYVQAAQALQLDPNGTETIGLSVGGAQHTAGKYISANSIGAFVRVRCIETGKWEVMTMLGTWTPE